MRELAWMATERRRWMGEMLGIHMAWVAGCWGGKMPDPLSLNPYRERPGKTQQTPEQIEHENAAGWAALDCFFGKRAKRQKQRANPPA